MSSPSRSSSFTREGGGEFRLPRFKRREARTVAQETGSRVQQSLQGFLPVTREGYHHFARDEI